jgi:hypothetical protein
MLQTSNIANWGIVAKLSRITDFHNIVIWFVWALKPTPLSSQVVNPTNYGENRTIVGNSLYWREDQLFPVSHKYHINEVFFQDVIKY